MILNYPALFAMTGAPRRYAAAQPWPHIVLDTFLGRTFAGALTEQIRATIQQQPFSRFERTHEVKMATEPGSVFASDLLQKAIGELNGPRFLEWLEFVTGIPCLIPDPYLVGGGLHLIRSGGHLGIHTDFSRHPKLPLIRRLNLLLYLVGDEWDAEWGGDLELWDDSGRCAKVVRLQQNRMVLFTTDHRSWHGHPYRLAAPASHPRLSVALYYYSAVDLGGTLPRSDARASDTSWWLEYATVSKGTTFHPRSPSP